MNDGEPYVLLVEGDDAVAQVKERELRSCGYAVGRASNASDAAEAVLRGERPVSLVLIDAALGNAMAGSAAAEVVLAQTQFPVVAFVSSAPGSSPDFTCHGCVAKDSAATVLATSLRTALRIFQENQVALRRGAALEDATSQVQLGLWEYDQQGSRFQGSEMVSQILGVAVTTGTDLDSVSKLFVSESPGILTRAIELSLNKATPFSLLSEVTTPSGQRKWVRTRGQIAEQIGSVSSGNLGYRKVFGTMQDMSELRLLERVTQESAMTLSQVEQITHIGHWSVSIVDGSFHHSDEIKRIFGYEPSEYALSVEDAINAYHPSDREELLRLFNRAASTGEGYEFDLRIVQPNADIRHVHSKGYTDQDDLGVVTRVYGVFQDITDRVLTESALRESEASMKTLIDSVHTAIVVHDKDGAIVLSNQMANRLLAPLTKSVFGKGPADPAWRFIFEDGREVSVEELPVSRILRSQVPLENLVLGRYTEDDVIWVLVNGVPVIDKNGEVSKVIVSFVDITEHREMGERLRQAEKLKAIGQLAGGVAHDFNNQLMVMSSFAELLSKSLPNDSVQHSWADAILAGVSRSGQLIKQLLAFARKGNYVVRSVDVNAIISDVVSIARHTFNKNIRVTHHAHVSPATIAADSSQLQNALLNMALNSRDAMPEGGELVFATSRVTLDDHFMKSSGLDIEPGDYVMVTIRDSGIGMNAATQKHIFEPFFTTKGVGEGTGMGLASVYGTVKNHRGSIHVESEPGAGTTIVMHFPLVIGEVPMSGEAEPIASKLGGRILIVDDDEGVTTSMSTLLNTMGYATMTCSSGQEALTEFERSWRSTDMVIVDMIMPEMSGLETFHALKAIDPGVNVVLISGYSVAEEATRMSEAGAAGFLLKPVTAKDLMQTVADVIRLKRDGKS